MTMLDQTWRLGVRSFVKETYEPGLGRLVSRLGLPEVTAEMLRLFSKMVSESGTQTTYSATRAITALDEAVTSEINKYTKLIEEEAVATFHRLFTATTRHPIDGVWTAENAAWDKVGVGAFWGEDVTRKKGGCVAALLFEEDA